MQTPSFVVRLADLERGPKQVTFSLSEDWLSRELSDASAVPLEPGTATLELMRTGATVMVRGSAHVKLTVPCVVTLDPVPLELNPEIFLELARDPETNERGKGAGKSPTKGGSSTPSKAIKAKTGRKGSRRGKDDPELSDEDAAYDTFKGEEIVLDPFLREFILLEIPPYPRRSDLPSPEESLSSRPLEGQAAEDKPIDPRLMPLLGLANRLRGARE
jgi:uncharacterized protein